jgi:hypothetical protein
LIANPKVVAAEYGMPIPAGLQVTVVENTPDKIYVVLPSKPDEAMLSEEQLEAVAGGLARLPDPSERPPSW